MTGFKTFLDRLKLFSITGQTQSPVRPGKGPQKWDLEVIDQVYGELIDRVGNVLDQIQLLGLGPLFHNIPSLKYLHQLLPQMESELLLQWKLKQENGLDAVFNRQKKWLSMEMRSLDGLFPTWNKLYRGILKSLNDPAPQLHKDPWKSIVLSTLANTNAMRDLHPVITTNQKDNLAQQICALFETLYTLSPHYLVVSFLNLIELGTGERPEVPDPGETLFSSEKSRTTPEVRTLIAQVINKNNWSDMPSRLLEYWRTAHPQSPASKGTFEDK